MRQILILTGCVAIGTGSAGAEGEKLSAHEWGTFTTLHWPDTGRQLAWYQTTAPNAAGNVSELPAFVHGSRLFKAGLRQTARMETPVIYFYTDRRQTVDVSVRYPGGMLTEYFPRFGDGSGHWQGLDIIPPQEAGNLAQKLPVDPARPDNHYYQARAVPDAAFVHLGLPAGEDGRPVPDELEKFVFYRGAGDFQTGLTPALGGGGSLTLTNFNAEEGFRHVWVLQSSAETVRWQKLAPFPAYDREARVPPVALRLESMPSAGAATRDASVAALRESMVSALGDAGLTSAEAAAMVATWDAQWYEEPGQRVFSIVPQPILDTQLPLAISPSPSALVRVFVHRAELLRPETVAALESAMAPDADPEKARRSIESEQLGRFVHGAIESVAEAVGWRTTAEYRQRGLKALVKPESVAAAR